MATRLMTVLEAHAFDQTFPIRVAFPARDWEDALEWCGHQFGKPAWGDEPLSTEGGIVVGVVVTMEARWSFINDFFVFRDEKEAMHFKLRWVEG